MRRIRGSLFILIFLLTNFLWAAPWDESMPIETAEGKAEAFIKISSLIPTMIEGAVRYGVNPVKLFENQVQIEELMKMDPHYQTLQSGSLRSCRVFYLYQQPDPIRW